VAATGVIIALDAAAIIVIATVKIVAAAVAIRRDYPCQDYAL
jgi:hypothetical protein